MFASMQRIKVNFAVVALAALTCVLWNAPAGRASYQFRDKINSVAKKIHQFMKQEGYAKSIALGTFKNPPGSEIKPGPGLMLVLHEEFKKLGVDTSPGASLTVHADCTLYDVPKYKKREAVLFWKVVDRNGKVLLVVDVNHTNQEDLDLFFPRPAILGKNQEVYAELHKGKSDLSMKILVNGKAMPPFKRANGAIAYVKLKQDDEYRIALHNSSKYCIAVLLKIDGINTFAFYDDVGGTREWRHIVPPNSVRVVKGWYETDEKNWAFRITDYAKSALKAKKLPPDQTHAGMITASYRYCVRLNKDGSKKDGIPPDLQSAASPNSLLTGKGTAIKDIIRNRNTVIGEPFGTVIIGYTK